MSSSESFHTNQNGVADGSDSTTTTSESSNCQLQQHKLRRQWQFMIRLKDTKQRKGQTNSQDWQMQLTPLGSSVKTVEEFWVTMNDVFKCSIDGNVFMFREGVLPMWEDKTFQNGGMFSFYSFL